MTIPYVSCLSFIFSVILQIVTYSLYHKMFSYLVFEFQWSNSFLKTENFKMSLFHLPSTLS